MQVRCLHCHQATEVADDSDFSHLVCSSCGGTFSLVGEETAPFVSGGRTLGRFELIEQVGAGTFGSVWKARDRELDRMVAVKVPRRDRLGPQETEHFLREARAAAQLRHPHIVTVHEVGRDGAVVYIVSDFVQGVTLGSWLSAHDLTPRAAATLCATVADALHHAHEMGVVHRDVKLTNIMLTPQPHGSTAGSTAPSFPAPRKEPARTSETVPGVADWVPMLMDFGLARRNVEEATLTMVGRIMGTPAFMSPEQARGEGHTADRRTDIYSLGVVLFRLLTGDTPFRGTTEMLVLQIMNEEPPSPRKLNRRVPRDLEIICLKCLEKDPGRRYQSGLELAEDLQRFLRGHPILARPAGRAERITRWVKRQPVLAALIMVSCLAALGLVGVGVGAIYHLQLRDAHERTQVALQGESLARNRAESARHEEELQRRRAELFQYFHHIALAHAEWRDGSVGRVQPLLNECSIGPRNWEWRYLDRLCRAEVLTIRGHGGWIYNVAYSPDGTRIAFMGADNSIQICNASNGQPVMSLKGLITTTSGFAFSPDGSRIATTDENGAIRFWHAGRGDPIGPLAGAKGSLFTYSPDGKLLALYDDDSKQLEVWDFASRKRVFRIPNAEGHVPAFSPDGTRFLLVRWKNLSVEVWELGNDKAPLLALQGHTSEARNAAYSPDGRRIATCSYDQTVRLWDAGSGRELHLLRGHTGEVTCVAFSPDGQRVASASMDQTVRVWDVASGRELLVFKGHAGGVHGVAFSPDGTRLASVSLDGTVKVWDATLAPEARTYSGQSHDFRYVTLAFDEAENRLHWASTDGATRDWDMELGQEVSGSNQPGNEEVVFSKDGKRAAVVQADGSVGVMNALAATARSEGNATNAAKDAALLRVKLPQGASYPLAFSADGVRLATISEDGVIRITDVATGQEIPGVGLRPIKIDVSTRCYRQIGLSPDLSKVVTAEKDQPAQVWDLATGQAIAKLEGGLAEDLPGLFAFSQDGTRLAGRTNSTVLAIWDAATGKKLAALEGHYHLIMCLTFNADGTRLASAGWDRTVKIWDTETGQEAITLRGHPTSVVGLAFSPDGAWLASASIDNTLKLWDARPWTDGAAAEREAFGLLHFYSSKPLCRTDVLAYAEHFPVTYPSARPTLIALARRFRENVQPQSYHDAAWLVVRQPLLNTLQYGFALKQAEAACRRAPDENRYRTTLGVAQYRAGNYAEAAATLLEADSRQPDSPINLAFLALAQQRLGQKDEARQTLTRSRDALMKLEANERADVQPFVREAETLIQD